MERLKVRDLRRALSFLEESYASPRPDVFVRHAVRGLLELIPADRSSYNECHPTPGRSVCADVEPATARHLVDAWTHFMGEHPVLAHYHRTGEKTSRKVSDFVTQTTFHRLALYNECYRYIGVEHQLVARLPAPRSWTAGFALSRSTLDFSERDRLLLDVLRPHLVQARAQAALRARVRAQLDALDDTLEASGCGIVVLAADGRIERATRRAGAWLRRYFGSGRRSAVLPEPLRLWLAHEENALAAADDMPPPRERFSTTRGDRQLTARLVTDRQQRMLFLEEHSAGPDAAALASLALTWRESEVLAWLANGKSNAEIAAILDTRPRTVAKHVERIFRKLGVENRTAAAARAFAAWRERI